jgi:hypothetical protein
MDCAVLVESSPFLPYSRFRPAVRPRNEPPPYEWFAAKERLSLPTYSLQQLCRSGSSFLHDTQSIHPPFRTCPWQDQVGVPD